MLQHMDNTGTTRFVPTLQDNNKDMQTIPWAKDSNPGYIQRGLYQFPKQGDNLALAHTQNFQSLKIRE